MASNIRVGASLFEHGGRYSLRFECDKAVVKDLAITVVSLYDIYKASGLQERLVDGIVFRCLGGHRNDQAIIEIKRGSLLVELQCFTDERFMEIWEDYESENLKKRLQEEFSACKIEIEGLVIDIENLDHVKETIAQIESRTLSGMSDHLQRINRGVILRDQCGDKLSHESMNKIFEMRISPRIIVQGGAYRSMIDVHRDKFIEGVKRAAKRGYSILTQKGKTAVDAVEEAVRIMENDEYFNAGYGSFLNCKGDVECDAMIMDGHTMKTGAVMAVRHFTNPVSLSRKVMEKTPHCALCADGARNFGKKIGIRTHDPKHLITKEASLRVIIGQEDFEKFVDHHYRGKMIHPDPGEQNSPVKNDTVTAVARDSNGHLACATSTGGIAGKMEGRIGDAPLVGCGGYANEFGAATSSGHGEALMKMTLARDVVFNMENGLDAQDSAKKSVERMQKRVNGYGGIIAIDKDGNFGKAFNTEVMLWASVKDDELSYGMKPDECLTEPI